MIRSKLLALSLALLLVASAGLALAKADDDERQDRDDDNREKRGDSAEKSGIKSHDSRGKSAEYKRHGDKWLYKNDQIAVWFHATPSGKAKPDLKVFMTNEDGNKSGYRVKIQRLYEIDGADYNHSGRLTKINLARAHDWNVTTHTDPGWLNITMTRPSPQGNVTLFWHLDTNSSAIKFDLKVDNWTWAANAASHRLVLDMKVVGKNLRDGEGNLVHVDGAGYISWAPTATASYGEADDRTLSVTAHRKISDDDEDDGEDEEDSDETERDSHLLLVFNGEGGYSALDYDPTFGVASTGATPRPVPAPAMIVTLAVVALAAIVVTRRR